MTALAAAPEEKIDFSDIPPLTDEFFENSVRNPFLYPPVRLSADVIEWFKERAKGDADMALTINHVLLDYIRSQKGKAAKKVG